MVQVKATQERIEVLIKEIYNPDEVKLYDRMHVISGLSGRSCVVLANDAQSALDYAADEDLLGQFKIDSDDDRECCQVVNLGNFSDEYDSTYMIVETFKIKFLGEKE